MKIEWTQPAVSDLENINNYIKKDSEYYATQFVGRIIEAIGNLKKFSEIGRKVPEADDKNIREILYYNYRIIYKQENNRILILTIIHGSRNLKTKIPKPWDIS